MQEIGSLKDASRKTLRNFGLLVGGVFCLLGLWFWLRHKPFYWYLFILGGPLLALGGAAPTALRWPYVSWMAFALVLGAIVSTVLLTALYFVVVTPIGLIAALVGKDFLRRKRDPGITTYWIRRDPSKTKEKHEYEQQF